MRRIGEFLASLGRTCEVIVVDDGSRPAGVEAARRSLEALPAGIGRRFLTHEVNRGKGAAVRTGCLAATGDYVAFIDADLATPADDLQYLIAALDEGADVAIGVRNQADGFDMRSQRSLPRRLAGSLFSLVLRFWLLPDIQDSQCPLKAFRRNAAQRLFHLQKIERWAFDAELLYLASRLGLKVAKRPVRWQAVEGSHLRLNLGRLHDLWSLLSIRWRHRGVTPSTLALASV